MTGRRDACPGTADRNGSERATAGNQLYDEDYDGDHQNEVDEPAADMKREAKYPQQQQDTDNRPEHCLILSC